MKTVALLLIPVALLCTSIAYAKRAAPAEVAPVTTDGLEYRAPHSQMGCVEAWDPVRNQLVWRRQVYVVKYDVAVERDIDTRAMMMTTAIYQAFEMMLTASYILITLGKQYHLIRPLRSKPQVFFYLALDRGRANLGMARLTLADVEKELQL